MKNFSCKKSKCTFYNLSNFDFLNGSPMIDGIELERSPGGHMVRNYRTK